jgi:2-polyprenyl-3-methyl-5-hydroxy-6-metoxy-1,4-benzoquinol methylase
MQEVPDERWLADTKEIYQKYDIYHQSGGVEQSAFDPTTGQAKRRSMVLAERLAATINLKERGRVLDFGCGNGAMLEALAAARPRWSLVGLDLDDRNRARLEQIPGFARLYTGPPEEPDGHFDLVTMIHSLEHISTPQFVLRSLRGKLGSGGWLFVQVPDAEENPFELVVADHLCHFTRATLAHLVVQAGFAVEGVETGWVTKEISLIARPAGVSAASGRPLACPLGADPVRKRVEWLHAVVEDACRAASAGVFGLFGTSISATWLFAHLAQQVHFFIDEDPGRAGGRHMQRPIWRPYEAPANASIYLALIPAIARMVRDRLRDLPLNFHLPPALPSLG